MNSNVSVADKVHSCSTPKLISTGSLNDLQSITLVAEGMAVVKFKSLNIVNAVIVLLASYYVFNAQYPKGKTGLSKNVYCFLEQILISPQDNPALPTGVENFLCSMRNL